MESRQHLILYICTKSYYPLVPVPLRDNSGVPSATINLLFPWYKLLHLVVTIAQSGTFRITRNFQRTSLTDNLLFGHKTN